MARAAEGSLRDGQGFLDQAACYSDGPISQSDAEEMLGLASEDLVRLAPANGADAEGTRRALQAMSRQAGSKHDPEVVNALCQVVEGGVTR